MLHVPAQVDPKFLGAYLHRKKRLSVSLPSHYVTYAQVISAYLLIPDVIHQHVQTTTAPHTAQLNMLAKGLQHVHLIAQNAHAAVAHALAAQLQDTAQSITVPELPRSTTPVTVDMSMDPDAYNDHLGNPVNHCLPTYTGAEDPGLWLLQVQALFQAVQAPATQQDLWMVTVFRGTPMTVSFVECAGQPAEPGIIATKLKECYRHYAYEYGLHAQMQSLQMQPGNYTIYADRFPSSPVSFVD